MAPIGEFVGRDVLTAPVRTIAGQQDIAVQLLDQSPVNFDEIVARDLISSYRQQLDNHRRR